MEERAAAVQPRAGDLAPARQRRAAQGAARRRAARCSARPCGREYGSFWAAVYSGRKHTGAPARTALATPALGPLLTNSVLPLNVPPLPRRCSRARGSPNPRRSGGRWRRRWPAARPACGPTAACRACSASSVALCSCCSCGGPTASAAKVRLPAHCLLLRLLVGWRRSIERVSCEGCIPPLFAAKLEMECSRKVEELQSKHSKLACLLASLFARP